MPKAVKDRKHAQPDAPPDAPMRTTNEPRAKASAKASAKRSRAEPTAWVKDATKRMSSLADPNWFVTGGTLELEEAIPSKAFTFTVPRNTDTYVFCYADGLPDVDGAGCDACSAIWDVEFGANFQYGWVGRQHFEYVVTRKEAGGPIAIEARLVSTPLELATTLLESGIQVNHLNE